MESATGTDHICFILLVFECSSFLQLFPPLWLLNCVVIKTDQSHWKIFKVNIFLCDF